MTKRSFNNSNGVPTTNKTWMGATVHGKDGKRIEKMLAGQNILEIEHCIYIHGMGQIMLEALKPHTVQRLTRQIHNEKIMIDGRSACLDGSTQNRDTNSTPMRPMETETFEESSEFRHCVLA